jgi:hypothetical protein
VATDVARTPARDPEAMRELAWVGGQALPLDVTTVATVGEGRVARH